MIHCSKEIKKKLFLPAIISRCVGSTWCKGVTMYKKKEGCKDTNASNLHTQLEPVGFLIGAGSCSSEVRMQMPLSSETKPFS